MNSKYFNNIAKKVNHLDEWEKLNDCASRQAVRINIEVENSLELLLWAPLHTALNKKGE